MHWGRLTGESARKIMQTSFDLRDIPSSSWDAWIPSTCDWQTVCFRSVRKVHSKQSRLFDDEIEKSATQARLNQIRFRYPRTVTSAFITYAIQDTFLSDVAQFLNKRPHPRVACVSGGVHRLIPAQPNNTQPPVNRAYHNTALLNAWSATNTE